MKRAAQVGRVASVTGGVPGRHLRAALLGGVSALTAVSLAFANPQGGEVVQGSATITTPTPATTEVNQTSDKAIIDWKSFNIGAGEKTVFNQPGATSVTLNRIFDQNPSIIAGMITANGRLILINANGMLFENGATVNTAGLLATTADIKNEDFMAGSLRFETPGAANASIENRGLITAEEGGVVAFVAPSVRNSGVITAKLGRVALGAGNTFTLDLYGDNLISFPVSAEIAQQLVGPDGKPLTSLVDVSGKIEAGSVQLTARAARGVIDNVINVDGEIIASGVTQVTGATVLTGGAFDGAAKNDRAVASIGGDGHYGGLNGTYGGRILIDGGSGGVTIAGTLTASGEKGGNVSIQGREINLSNAKVDASGRTGGGNIAIGYSGDGASRAIGADTIFVSQGSSLKADAIETGNGGRIEFWSNLATDFRGAISARGGMQSGDGGFLEVSSKGEVGFWGAADASAAQGEAGVLLLDPKNIIISSAGTGLGLPGLTNPNQLTFAQSSTSTLTVNPGSITATLNTGTAVRLQANNDLTVSSDIIANNPTGNGGALTLQAGRSVLINADITTDNGNLTIVANELLSAGVINSQRDPGSAVLTMGAGADINAGTGAVRLTIASGLGKTNRTSGNMTLRNVSGGSIIAENLGPSNGNVTLASGALSASGTGTPIVVASQGGAFVNNAGAGALQAPNGRWIVYSQNPAANTLGGLSADPFYNTPYNAANPTSLSATGNRFAYTLAPTLTVRPNNTSRVYGDPNPAFTYAISGLVGGDLLANAVQGAPAITTLADVNSSVAGGPYAINASLGTLASDFNYGFNFAPGSLAITPAQLFYLAEARTNVYGDVDLDVSGILAGLKNGDSEDDAGTGDVVFGTTATATSGVGLYAITGSGFTVTNSNYVLTVAQDASNATAYAITQAQLFYSANGEEREYGEANPLFGGELDGLVNNDTLESVVSGLLAFGTTATATSNVGVYAVNGSGLTVINPNYAITILQDPDNATALLVTQATLTYVADTATRIYGDANQLFTGSVTGMKNGETIAQVATGTAVFLSSATATSPVGLYDILGSGLAVTSGNYRAIIEQDSDNDTALEINPATLFYRADPKSKIYGAAIPLLTGTLTGLKNGETLNSVVSGTLVWDTNAGTSSDVGVYNINGDGLTVINTNYETVIEQALSNDTALTINPAQLTYVADKKSRVFAFPDPAFTGSLGGLVNDDKVDDAVIGNAVFTTTATAASPGGYFYAINGSGLTVTSANYLTTILQDPGNATAFEIVAIPLTSTQALNEGDRGVSEATDQPQDTMTTRPNDLNIEGALPPGLDVEDGKNDDLAGQLCALGAPEAAGAPGCVATTQSH